MRTTYKMLHEMNPIRARHILLEKLEKNEGNVKKTAKQFKTQPKIVRKWRDRHKRKGKEGLKDLPCTPKAPKTAISQHPHQS